MIPNSHHGSWHGPNRLWFEGPEPERSEGRVEVGATTINYKWSFRGQGQVLSHGRIRQSRYH